MYVVSPLLSSQSKVSRRGPPWSVPCNYALSMVLLVGGVSIARATATFKKFSLHVPIVVKLHS